MTSWLEVLKFVIILFVAVCIFLEVAIISMSIIWNEEEIEFLSGKKIKNPFRR